MVGISAVTVNNVSAQAQAANQSSETAATEDRSTTQVDTSKITGNGQAQGAQGAQGGEGSGESAAIKQLRQMIKDLQKQLAEQQKQLAAIMAKDMDESAKLAQASAKQASITTINGEILRATAQLLEALQETGGSSAGGIVSTQA
ncbi:hypothetical protein C4Q28_11000 [Pseudomonas sp. SWI6]|uniref:Uncharacterized protein n=1 Tax=Pseudomonas taiwanensis TaxID=470150 RepID=A0ABR6V1P5_9PSED|nr:MULTISPECIES: hypothetical protein [Pseudomonas]AGZ35839.1 hypothetical protein PVLB_15275 [Pseudomonas sp. VLB120]AVD82640.1 hypothetical protein C4Q28_11000 [Pseudomonas sp. SWI6]AVD89596.1 hypothetical protein C4Q26_21705 [Pseudomonas sp. SWI44]MBC3474207.1 hypothetical protein [Pseudomonas taiwanensis]MBC3492360.1 hypothetical protein [Pseudomonas taiwanensis]